MTETTDALKRLRERARTKPIDLDDLGSGPYFGESVPAMPVMETTDLQIENFDTTPPEVLRLDALIKAVCLMHNALEWADRRYSGVYGEQIKEALLPLLDDLKTRGKL